MTQLKEEKLQALGVSAGNESKSGQATPSSAAMSRQPSARNPLLQPSLSPPPLTTSSVSNQSGQLSNPFSPPLLPAGMLAAGLQGGPYALAGSMSAAVPPLRVPDHVDVHESRSAGALDGGLRSPLGPRGLWQNLNPPIVYQAAGAGGPGNLPPLAPILRRTSSLDQHVAAQLSEVVVADATKQERDPAAGGGTDATPRPRPQRVNSDLLWHRNPRPGLGDQAGPHRENSPSHTAMDVSTGQRSSSGGARRDLQGKLHDAEYHLEASIERQMAEGDDSRMDDASPFDSEDVIPHFNDIVSQVGERQTCTRFVPMPSADPGHDMPLISPQPRRRQHALSNSTTHDRHASAGSVDAMKPSAIWPSRVATNIDQTDEDQRHTRAPHVRHASATAEAQKVLGLVDPGTQKGASQASGASRWNVEAEEFKFEPGRALLSNAFAFDPRASKAGMAPARATGGNAQVPQARRSNAGAPIAPGTKLNVQAATFMPRDPTAMDVPTADFSFSSMRQPVWPIWPSRPSLSIDHRRNNSEAAGHGYAVRPDASSRMQSKIFDLPRRVEARSRSKAVPILAPDHRMRTTRPDDGDEEDESGHITRGQSWDKKPRRTGRDVDERAEQASYSRSKAEIVQPQGWQDDASRNFDAVPITQTRSPSTTGVAATPVAVGVKGLTSDSANPPEEIGQAFSPPQKASESSESYYTATTTGAGQYITDTNRRPPDHAWSQTGDATLTRPVEATNGQSGIGSRRDSLGLGVTSVAASVADNVESSTLATGPAQESSGYGLSGMRPLTLVTRQEREIAHLRSNSRSRADLANRMSWPMTGSAGTRLTVYRGTASEGNNDSKSQLDKSGSDQDDSRSLGLSQAPTTTGALTEIPDHPSPLQEKRSDGSSYGQGPSPSSTSSSRGSQTLLRRRSRIEPPFVRRHTSGTPDLSRPHSFRPRHRPSASEIVPSSTVERPASPSGDMKFQSPSQFLEGHFDRLIQRLLDHRLSPLGESMAKIQESMAVVAQTAVTSGKQQGGSSKQPSNSDADDEDDDSSNANAAPPKSPRRDPRLEKFKAAIAESLEAHTSTLQALDLASELSAIHQVLLEIKASSGREPRRDLPDVSLLRSIIKETFVNGLESHRKALGQSNVVNLGESQRLVSALEQLIGRAEQSSKVQIHMRAANEEDVNELQRQRRLSAVEAAQQRSLAEVKQRQLQTQEETHRQSTLNLRAQLDGARSELERVTTDLSAANASLKGQLREALLERSCQREAAERLTSTQAGLNSTIKSLEDKLEDGARARAELERKCTSAEEDLGRAMARAESGHTAVHHKDEQLRALEISASETLRAAASVEERLENEVKRSEREQREAVRMEMKCEELQSARERLDTLIEKMRVENLDLQRASARLQGELDEAKATGQAEVRRTKILLEAEMDATRRQAEQTRAELESDLARARMDVEFHKLEHESATARGQIQLEEAEKAKTDSMKDAAQAQQKAWREQEESHQRQLNDVWSQHELALQRADGEKQRNAENSLERLRLADDKTTQLQQRIELLERTAAEEKQRAGENLLERIQISEQRNRQLQERADFLERSAAGEKQQAEDRLLQRLSISEEGNTQLRERIEVLKSTAAEQQQRTVVSFTERLHMSEERNDLQQEKVELLEEKLEIARSAASAAAQAAQQAKTSTASGGSPGADGPVKLSPQALRESILVLQDQLQEREGRIEALEQDLSQVDGGAPAKIKEQQVEIGWLRELLDLRIGDLEDVIQCLSTPDFDRDAVHNAVIRLKANLEMEQQERERSTMGTRTLSASLASVSSSLSTPKAVLPLAAAWGSWRKARRDSYSAESRTPSRQSPSPSVGSRGIFAGLLTPPGTQTRPDSGRKAPSAAPISLTRPATGHVRTPSQASDASDLDRDRASQKMVVSMATRDTQTMDAPGPSTPTMPTMPTMLQREAYDDDATSQHLGDNSSGSVDGESGHEHGPGHDLELEHERRGHHSWHADLHESAV